MGFTNQLSYEECIRETFDIEQAGAETKELKRCRQTIADWENERGKIGGGGRPVQIDESKFGTRKYNQGRHVEGYWVLGMIEDGSSDFRLVLCPENCRDAETLLLIIEQHTVNHSDPEHRFITPEGVHTNRVESSWRPAKDWFRKFRGRQKCKNCRDVRNIMCEECKAGAGPENCNECQQSTFEVCKACLKQYNKCNKCQEIKWSCEDCYAFRSNFIGKMVVYQ